MNKNTTVKQDRVLIIDGMNTYIRSWMIIPITNDDGEHFGGVFGFLKSIKAAVEKFRPTEVVIAWDGVHGGLRRKTLFPEYKAHRQRDWKRGAVKAFDFLDEHEQHDNFVMQLKRVKEYLELLPVKTIRIPYVEADDIIAIYAQQLPKTSQVVIYSSDADFKQLVTDNIVHYNPISKKMVSRSSFRDEVGIDPKNFVILKAALGDKSDNIPGIHGVGNATTVKLFPELSGDSTISIEEIIARANTCGFTNAGEYTKAQRGKFKLFAEHADILRRNYRLMQLIDPEVSTEAVKQVLDAVSEQPQPFNSLGLKIMFMQDKLEKTVRRFDDWTNTFSGLQTR